MSKVRFSNREEKIRRIVPLALKKIDRLKLEDLLSILYHVAITRYYDDNVVELFKKTFNRLSNELVRLAKENSDEAMKMVDVLSDFIDSIKDYLVMFNRGEIVEIFIDNFLKELFKYPSGFYIAPNHIAYIEKTIRTSTIDDSIPVEEIASIILDIVRQNLSGEIFNKLKIDVSIKMTHFPDKSRLKNNAVSRGYIGYEIKYSLKNKSLGDYNVIKIPVRVEYVYITDPSNISNPSLRKRIEEKWKNYPKNQWVLYKIILNHSLVNFARYEADNKTNLPIEDILMSRVHYNIIYLPSLISKLISETNKQLDAFSFHKFRFHSISEKTGEDVVSSFEARFMSQIARSSGNFLDIKAEPLMFSPRYFTFTKGKELPKITIKDYTIIFTRKALKQLLQLLPEEAKIVYEKMKKTRDYQLKQKLAERFAEIVRKHLSNRDNEIYLGLSKDNAFGTNKILWCFRVVTEHYTPIPHRLLFGTIDNYLISQGHQYDSWWLKFYKRTGKMYVLKDQPLGIINGTPVYFGLLITNSNVGDKAVHITPCIIYKDLQYNYAPVDKAQVVVHKGEPAEILAKVIEIIKQMEVVKPKYTSFIGMLWQTVPEKILLKILDELVSTLPQEYRDWVEKYYGKKGLTYKELVSLINKLIYRTREKSYSLRLLSILRSLFH